MRRISTASFLWNPSIILEFYVRTPALVSENLAIHGRLKLILAESSIQFLHTATQDLERGLTRLENPASRTQSRPHSATSSLSVLMRVWNGRHPARMVRSRRVSVTVILFTAGVLLVCVWRVGSEQQRLSESGLLDWINLKASLIDDSSLFSDHEVPINDSELSSDLLRRASVNWNDAVSRAQRLLCLMEMAEEDLPATFQTAWTSFSSLTQYGWTSSQLYGAVDTALQSPFNQFGLSDTMPPLVQVQWSHSQDSTVGGIKYQVGLRLLEIEAT